MDCVEFRESYSDYADGLLDETAEVEARRHLASCPACRRFDEAFQAGVRELRAMPVVAPSRSFELELERRILHESEAAEPALRRWSGVAGSVLVVVVVGVIGLERAQHQFRRPAPRAVPIREGVHLGPAGLPSISDQAIRLAGDSFFVYDDPFHPIPAAADSHLSFYTQQLRFETPAVWAGH